MPNPDMDFGPGDLLAHPVAAHPQALRDGGTAYLTDAFRRAGALPAACRVSAITRCEVWPGGSTGRKLVLSVRYDPPVPGLHEDLFVKFSRDFDDPVRDGAKVQMEAEVRFALLSRAPGFPVAVPRCMFADYDRETGTGILITERVAFGTAGIEPHHEKCRDYDLPDALGHYQALVAALARLAGSHRAGAFDAETMAAFAADPSNLMVSARKPYDARQIRNRVARLGDFVARFPKLLPAEVSEPRFLARLADEGARFADHAGAVDAALRGTPELIALCHWNANVDNAWFWRDDDGSIACGLMDWGNVGQMNMATALAGCVMAAEPDFLVAHLDRLIAHFADALAHASGLIVDTQQLTDHLALSVASSGLMWLLDAPVLLERAVPDLANVSGRFDPRIADHEHPRTQLHMLTVFLTLWRSLDFGTRLDRQLRPDGGAEPGGPRA